MGKVDTIVIFASGKGKRLQPLTFDTPKPLIKINGEVLIERLIKQSNEANIDEIYVVVGYLEDKFQYLADKYNVKLIYNEDFLSKDSLATLHKAEPYLKGKNFIVSSADIYVKENIFKEFENQNDFKVFCFDKNIVYFDKDSGIELFNYCDELYKGNSNDKLKWEYIIDKYKDKDKFSIAKAENNQVIDFDTYEDIKNYDSDVDTGCKSIEYIKKVFSVSEKDIIIDSIVTGGITNYSYSFHIVNDNKKYLMRVPGNGTEYLIDRKLEAEVLNEMKKYNIAEDIVYIDDKTGYKISVFIEDGKIIDVNDDNDLKFAMAKLKELHNINIDLKNTKNLFDWVAMYENAIIKDKLKFPFDDHDIIKKKIDTLTSEIKMLNRKHSFCHGDANPSNMLKTKGEIKFIDFEYVNIFDPAFELSMFALNAGFKYNKLVDLLKYYIEANPQNDVFKDITFDEAHRLVVMYFAISQYYCYLWGIVFMHIKSVDFNQYIIECHDKMLEAIKFLEANRDE